MERALKEILVRTELLKDIVVRVVSVYVDVVFEEFIKMLQSEVESERLVHTLYLRVVQDSQWFGLPYSFTSHYFMDICRNPVDEKIDSVLLEYVDRGIDSWPDLAYALVNTFPRVNTLVMAQNYSYPSTIGDEEIVTNMRLEEDLYCRNLTILDDVEIDFNGFQIIYRQAFNAHNVSQGVTAHPNVVRFSLFDELVRFVRKLRLRCFVLEDYQTVELHNATSNEWQTLFAAQPPNSFYLFKLARTDDTNHPIHLQDPAHSKELLVIYHPPPRSRP
jgi:hypothetical protein